MVAMPELVQIANDIEIGEPTDIQAGLDFLFGLLDDDPDEPFDPSDLTDEEESAASLFIDSLENTVDFFRRMFEERTGQRHRRSGDDKCEQPCRACLREADIRAGVGG